MRRLAILLSAACLLAPAAVASAAGVPAGTYSRTVSLGASSGVFTITFAASGTYRTTFRGAFASAGRSTARGRSITFASETGPLSCRGTQAKGSYTWALRGGALRFTRVADTCAGRVAVLAGPLRRS